MFEELINSATDSIINEIGPQILDSISRENIKNKVIEIVSSGTMDEEEIIQKFLDDNKDVLISLL